MGHGPDTPVTPANPSVRGDGGCSTNFGDPSVSRRSGERVPGRVETEDGVSDDGGGLDDGVLLVDLWWVPQSHKWTSVEVSLGSQSDRAGTEGVG